MTASQTETPVGAYEERIGTYRVHPVASMFPRLEGQEWEDFRRSIKVNGQLNPVIVQGDLLLDGRNRMAACLELGIEPRVEEYTGKLDPVDYIEASNISRRSLDVDKRTAICTQIHMWRTERDNAEKQAAQGYHGVEGGRGHKKTLEMNSSPGFGPKTRAKDARSTVGQIATKAKVSHHKASQAVAVHKAAPEMLEQVKAGKVKLKDAVKKNEGRRQQIEGSVTTGAAKHSGPSYLDAKTKCMGKLHDAMRTLNKVHYAYPVKQDDLEKAVEKMIRLGPPPLGGDRFSQRQVK